MCATRTACDRSWTGRPARVRGGGGAGRHTTRHAHCPLSPAQVNGGKWIVRLKKGLAARYWEEVLLAVLGGQFRVGDEICGCVLSVRYQEDILSVWNRSADSRRVCMQIRDTMRNLMGLPLEATMEYKKHTDSMRDNSSFRNAVSEFRT